MMPPLFLATLFSTWGLAAALAAVCFLVLRGNWFRQRRAEEATADPQTIQQSYAPKAREGTSHHAPEDLLRWQVEMHETARDMKAEIDTKLLALQSLITLANEHAQRLESLIEQAEPQRQASSSASPACHSDPRPITTAIPTGREILNQIEACSKNLPPLDPRAAGREILTPAQAKLARQLLAEEEYTAEQIASYVGAPVVDVQFFLSLARRT